MDHRIIPINVIVVVFSSNTLQASVTSEYNNKNIWYFTYPVKDENRSRAPYSEGNHTNSPTCLWYSYDTCIGEQYQKYKSGMYIDFSVFDVVDYIPGEIIGGDFASF